MERDFFGLNSKDSFSGVKDGCEDPAFMKGTGMHGYFSNKVSVVPHFMSFDGSNNPASSTSQLQKNLSLNRQGGTNYAITGYPVQHIGTHSSLRSHEMRMSKQQLLGGIPVTAPISLLPSANSIAGTDDSRFLFKPLGTPSQLTIFYGGAVNVYDDISPEQAQAIRFMAGNGSSMTTNKTNPKAQIQGLTAKMVVGDAVTKNQCHSTPPSSGLSSPLSITSHASSQPHSGSSSTDDLLPEKPKGAFEAPISLLETVNIVTSLGSTTVTLMSSDVPQTRKASLARFFEKRKERIMNTVPYNLNNKP